MTYKDRKIVRNMANREEGAAAPNQRQGQEQHQHRDAAGQ